ncbi:hypothetical protein WJX79_005463 [Trebouxia sp. C0005]|nr:MAG: glycine cleavage H [Trebouxia sp. A1-2]
MALRVLATEAVSSLGLRRAVPVLSNAQPQFLQVFSQNFASVAKDLVYQDSHEWAKVDGDTATVGISDFAQAELGDIVYVELPEVGSEVKKGEQFGVIESVKAASDVNSPVSGEVSAVNDALTDESNKVNKEPYSGGWLMKVKLSDKGELKDLMDATKYEDHCAKGDH